MEKRKIGYLSAAPRVSTHRSAELVGPRTHILGVMRAFEALGWEVKEYIVGDRVPQSWIVQGSEENLRRSKLRILLADLMRIILGVINSRRAYREIGADLHWVYERLAIFQSLGWIFKKKGKFWILETNAPLFVEAKSDRNAIVLNSLARYFEIQAYRNCDAIVCISDNLKDIIVEEAQISPKKVFVVPNGVDINRFDPATIQPIRLFDGFTIGFVGNIASWQGINLLLDVYQEIREEGFDINLVFIGDGPLKSEIEEKVNNLNYSKYVKFTGFVPQDRIPGYIAGFDIGYTGQTLRTEARMYCSPIKLYEYMAMGIPAIASDYEDTRRVIKNGAGFLFRIEDSQDLKRTILSAYEEKEKLHKMGEVARDVILQNHSWEARVSKLLLELEESFSFDK